MLLQDNGFVLKNIDSLPPPSFANIFGQMVQLSDVINGVINQLLTSFTHVRKRIGLFNSSKNKRGGGILHILIRTHYLNFVKFNTKLLKRFVLKTKNMVLKTMYKIVNW